MPLLLELSLHKTPRLGDVVLAGVWACLLVGGRVASHTGTEAVVTGKGLSIGVQEGGVSCYQVR